MSLEGLRIVVFAADSGSAERLKKPLIQNGALVTTSPTSLILAIRCTASRMGSKTCSLYEEQNIIDVPFNWDANTDARGLRVGYLRSAFEGNVTDEKHNCLHERGGNC